MSYIGIDIGGTHIKSVLIHSDGSVFRKLILSTNAAEGPDAVIQQINLAIQSLIHNTGREINILGIGIGAPGSVDFQRGILLHPPNLPGWEEVSLVSIIEDRWRLDVVLDNDANCAALGEARFGAGKDHSNFIALTLGTGVGSGIIINRSIFHGDKGYGGEFGHVSIDYKGPQCLCGNTGCVEAYVGINYLVANACEVISRHPECSLFDLVFNDPVSLNPKLISDAANEGDTVAREILYQAGNKLGIAIASVANLLDISTFIVGGGIAAAGKPLFDGIKETANTRTLKVHREKIAILPAALGNDAGMLGAASLLQYAG